MPTRLFPTRVDLSPATRGQMIDLLNQQLADLADLYSQSKQAHWNVKGIEFYQLHELFDDLAESIFGFIDIIAERAVQLGGEALGTTRQAANASTLPEFPAELTDSQPYVEALAERFGQFATSTRQAIDTATNAGDASTADLFIDVSRVVDKGLWFLEAHLRR